ncbi:MAG: hypothetical protein J7K72_01570 [Candidatus Aenigmarchaeota archaeon]|nr:hypothetical protein [Candidatus Aenigmarchaeota archaeon]
MMGMKAYQLVVSLVTALVFASSLVILSESADVCPGDCVRACWYEGKCLEWGGGDCLRCGLWDNGYCSKSCGASCVGDADCPADGWYCNGDTREYRNYYCDTDCSSANACTCQYNVEQSEDCNQQDGWYGGGNTGGCGDDPSSEYRDYTCSGGSCTYTVTQTQDCDSSDICSNTCVNNRIYSYKDYYVQQNTGTCAYATGSLVEDCTTKPSICIGTCGSGTNSCKARDYTGCSGTSSTCNVYTDYDVDSSQTRCELCLPNRWNLGGEVSSTTCCGDDANEYEITSDYSATVDGSPSPSNACCNANNKCVHSDTCYASGTAGVDVDGDGDNDYCSSGIWYDCSTDSQCASGYSCVNNDCIDITAPTVSVLGAPSDWQNTDATASVSCSDDGSGCDSTSYRLKIYISNPGSCPSNYADYDLTSPQAISSHVWVCASAKDNAGNTGFSDPVEFKVDKTPPTADITGESTSWVTSDDITLTCTDSGGSGCNTTKWYYFDPDGQCSTSKSSYTSSTTSSMITINTNHNDWLCLWVEDNAGNHDVTVSSQLMIDATSPETTINPDGGDFTGQNETSFTLTCQDSGGSGCDKTYYKIINNGETCGTSGYIDGTSGLVTCPFGQACDKRVCFYSIDAAGNQESVNQSGVFHLETNACQDRQCGEPCLYTEGICSGPGAECYVNGGCMLNCSAPEIGPGQERIWLNQNCGRTNATKCGESNVCSNSITNGYCSVGGTSTQITADWTSYQPPAGVYGTGSVIHIKINGVSSSPSTFSILTECEVVKANGNIIYFDNWGSGNIDFAYTIKENDPEGIWNITYCGLWSDFEANGGWQIKINTTFYTFMVDKTPPIIVINNPKNGDKYNGNFIVNATVTDQWSGVSQVFYRWENSTNVGEWIEMTNQGGYYIADFDVNSVSDGLYVIRVNANDSVGNEGNASVQNILIDREPPNVTILLPEPSWYNSDFEIRAEVKDNQGVSQVFYRWENSTNVGEWIEMNFAGNDEYTAIFDIYSVTSGNYTIKVFANDTIGNEKNKTIDDIGIDYIKPHSQITEPIPDSYMMDTVFNISWTGSDQESGIKCCRLVYMYCDSTGLCSNEQYATFGCVNITTYEFDAQTETGIEDLDGYTFHFKSIALDNANNIEEKTQWDTNLTIYIPKLVTFTVTDNKTGANIRNGGKVATNRTVIISVQAKEDVQDNLNIRIYYSNHTIGEYPSNWLYKECRNTKTCNVSIKILVEPAEEKVEVDYYIFAENASDTSIKEFIPPSSPNNYFYYTVYYHPLCNFAVKGYPKMLQLVFGSTELIPIEIRNIQNKFDSVNLEVTPFAKFVENGSSAISIGLNPQEEKTVYIRVYPRIDNFEILLSCTSSIDEYTIDNDNATIMITMPAEFPGLSDYSVVMLVVLSGMIYLIFVKKSLLDSEP